MDNPVHDDVELVLAELIPRPGGAARLLAPPSDDDDAHVDNWVDVSLSG